MKRSLLGTLALAGALVACDGSTSPTKDFTASTPGAGSRVTLRFINAGADGPANLYVNSALKLQAQAFGLVDSAYLQASSVPQTVSVKTPGGSALASAQITFAMDTAYTVLLAAGGQLLVLPDTVPIPAYVPPDAAPPPAGIASFRIVHVIGNVWFRDQRMSVDVYRTTGSTDLTNLTPMASNVAFQTLSPYTAYPAGPTRIIVTPHGDPITVLYDSGIRTVSAGEAWTIFLLKYLEEGVLADLWFKDRD